MATTTPTWEETQEIVPSWEDTAPIEAAPEVPQPAPRPLIKPESARYTKLPRATVNPTPPAQDINQPFIPIPKFEVKEDDSIPVAAGKEAVNLLVGIPEFFETPLGVMTAPVGGVFPKTVSAIFSADMVKNLGQQIVSNYKNWSDMGTAQKTAAIVDMIGTGTLAGILGRKALKGEKSIEKTTTTEESYASSKPSATGIPSPQVRPGMDETAPLQQQGEVAQVPPPEQAQAPSLPQEVKPPSLTPVLEIAGKPVSGESHAAIRDAELAKAKTPEERDAVNLAFIDQSKHKFQDQNGNILSRDEAKPVLAQITGKPVTKPVESSDIPVEKKGVVPEMQPEVIPQKRPVMNMAGQVRQKRPPFLGPPAFETLHPNAQAKFNVAWDAKDATAMKELLHLQNKGLRGEFAKRTGIKLPNTQGGTKTTIDSWAKGAFDKNKEPVVTPAPSEQSLPPTGGVSETGAASTTPPVIEKISTTKGKGQELEPGEGEAWFVPWADGRARAWFKTKSAADEFYRQKLAEDDVDAIPQIGKPGTGVKYADDKYKPSQKDVLASMEGFSPAVKTEDGRIFTGKDGVNPHQEIEKQHNLTGKRIRGFVDNKTGQFYDTVAQVAREIITRKEVTNAEKQKANQKRSGENPEEHELGKVLAGGSPEGATGNRGILPSVTTKLPVWKVSYIDLEDRMMKRPFFKKTVYSEGKTRTEAIERVKNYHGNSGRYGEFKASKAEGKVADVFFRAPKETPSQPPMFGPGSPSKAQGPDTGPGWMSSDTADDSVSGVADRVRKLRENAGKTAPTVPGEGIAPEASVERGNELLGKGANPDAIMANFEATKRASSDDMAVVRAQQTVLSRITNRTEEKFGTDSPEYRAAYTTESAWAARTKAMQTEWAKAGHAQQGEVDIDTGTFTGLRRAVRDVTGKDLTPSQTVKAKAVAAKVSEAEKAVEPAKVNLQNAIDNLDERGVPIYSDYVLKLAEKIVSKLDARAEASRKALREMSMRFNTGIDPTVIGHLANIGASHIAHFGLDFVKWSDAMIRDVGPKVKPYLADIFNRSQQLVDAEAELHGPAKEQVRSVVKKTRTTRAPADLDSQRKVFGNFIQDKPMNPEQVKTLWQRAKSEYIDKGNDDKMDIVHKLATDFGIPAKDVLRGLNQKKSVKRVADDVWQKQRQARLLKSAAKRWVEKTNETILQKAFPFAVKAMFSAKVALHGTVAIGTHAPLEAFAHPIITAKNFGKMYRMVASPEYYQMQQYELARRPNYTPAQRGGLVNDMSKMEDFNDPALAQGFPKMAEWFRQKLAKVGLSRLQGMGTRGYGVLKILRQDLFDNEWNKLAESERTPDMAKAIADSVNHMTGVVKANVHPAANVALFAPKLLLSRLQVMGGDPFKAVNSLLHMKEMTPAEKWFATNQLKEKAKIFGVASGLLLANQQLNKLFGDDKKLNGVPEVLGGGGVNPMASDFMKFRVAGMNFAWGSPFLTMMRLPLRIIQIGMGSGGKSRFLIYPDESMSYEVFKYLRSQSSPFAQPILSLVTKTDFQGRPLPQIPGYGQPPPVPKRLRAQGVEPYTWTEFAAETMLPIPFQEAAKEVFHYLKMGTTEQKEKSLLKALTVVLIMGGTGGRLSEDWNKPAPVSTATKSQTSGYSVGQTVQRGGSTYRIVGFDTDGEPLVEKAQ